MNDIKTAERSSMGSATLKNLMLWHRGARKLEADGTLSSTLLSCREVGCPHIDNNKNYVVVSCLFQVV